MATGARVKVTNNLGKFTQERDFAAARAITAALVVGAAEVSVLTPIDTGTLINSQTRDVGKIGSKVVGVFGYTARYAVPVHDPDVKQRFRRATAVKEFVKKGFENAAPQIEAILKGQLKV